MINMRRFRIAPSPAYCNNFAVAVVSLFLMVEETDFVNKYVSFIRRHNSSLE